MSIEDFSSGGESASGGKKKKSNPELNIKNVLEELGKKADLVLTDKEKNKEMIVPKPRKHWGRGIEDKKPGIEKLREQRRLEEVDRRAGQLPDEGRSERGGENYLE